MLERADTSEVIDLNTLALPLYSVIYWASAPMKEPIFLAIILFRLCDPTCPACSGQATGHGTENRRAPHQNQQIVLPIEEERIHSVLPGFKGPIFSRAASSAAPGWRYSLSIHFANAFAQYVIIMSAPARRNPVIISITERFSSSQPNFEAALSMAYSPLTL